MRRLILPVLLALAGLGGGVGAGVALRAGEKAETPPDPCGRPGGEAGKDALHADDGGHGGGGDVAADNGGGHGSGDGHGSDDGHGDESGLEYVKLNNQFVVPVVEGGEVAALVILSVSLEVTTGSGEAVYAREPKLRDLFLEVLFAHANAGGFGGVFTETANMEALRGALLEVARKPLGNRVSDVLITDIVRQDT